MVRGIMEGFCAERAVTGTVFGHRIHEYVSGIHTTMHGHTLQRMARGVLLGRKMKTGKKKNQDTKQQHVSKRQLKSL